MKRNSNESSEYSIIRVNGRNSFQVERVGARMGGEASEKGYSSVQIGPKVRRKHIHIPVEEFALRHQTEGSVGILVG